MQNSIVRRGRVTWDEVVVVVDVGGCVVVILIDIYADNRTWKVVVER